MIEEIRDVRTLEHTVMNKEVNQVQHPRKHRRIRRKPMLLTLCPACASQFYRMRDHYIKRVDMEQSVKEECCYCCVRRGYDFLVFDNSHKKRDYTSVA